MKRRFGFVIIVAVTSIVSISLMKSSDQKSSIKTLSLCLPQAANSALPALAKALGYFKSEGLQVEAQLKSSGPECISELTAARADFASSCLYSAVKALSAGHQISLISELHSAINNTSIVSRTEEMVEANVKESWKKIAFVQDSNAESVLRLYFKSRQIAAADIQFFPVKSASEIPPLLLNRKVDAAVLHEPDLSNFLAENANQFSTRKSSFYTEFSVLSSRAEFAAKDSDTVDRLVRALSKAQKFYENNPEEAHEIIVSELQLDPAKMNPDIWPKFRIGLGLSSVLKSMIDQEAINFSQEGNPDLAETSAINISLALFPQSLRKISSDLVTFE